jgi:hypothetical protein
MGYNAVEPVERQRTHRLHFRIEERDKEETSVKQVASKTIGSPKFRIM